MTSESKSLPVSHGPRPPERPSHRGSRGTDFSVAGRNPGWIGPFSGVWTAPRLLGYGRRPVRTGSVPRKIVLPDGELRRFHLPEEPPAPGPGRRSWRGKTMGAVGAWLLFSFVCVHWSEGRLGPRSWLEGTLGWLAALRVEAPKPAAAPPRPRPTVPAEPAHTDDQVAIVSQPSLTSAPKPPLSRHVGSFDALLEPAESPLLGPPGPSFGLLEPGFLEPGRTGDDALAVGEAQEVYAGPSCERARLRFKPSFLADAEPANLALLGESRRYAHCKPDLMSLRLCALVHRGEAIGVTVQSEPPNRRVSTCAAIVAKTLHYPKQKRPQLLRTEIYFK